MRARTLVAIASASLLGAGVSTGCVDLFHSTDFQTLCDVDARQCPTPSLDADLGDTRVDGPRPDARIEDSAADGARDGGSDASDAQADADAGPPPPTDFCTWTVAQAHERARHACAWLGACAGPVYENAFGTCLDQAILAYDCQVNPNRPVIGKAHKFWDCLWQSASCSDVTRCVFPGGAQTCGTSASEYGSCGSLSGNAATVLDCPSSGGTPLGVENCAIVGRTCDPSGVCVGGAGQCAAIGTKCDGATHLRDCAGTSPLTDVGLDCSNVGTGACVSADGGTPGCKPTGNKSCTPTSTVTCVALTTATSCATGFSEQVDCRGLMEDAGTCSEGQPGRPWDITRGCVASAPECTTEKCNDDGGLQACHRGQIVNIACGAYNLKPCMTMENFLIKSPACTH